MQKSVLSVESNFVEGATRDTDAEFLRFSRYSLSSAFELRTQLLVAKDLGYLPPAVHDRQAGWLEEIRKMLWSLIVTLEQALGRRPAKVGPTNPSYGCQG
jgi:four helix bundle protein